jgi:hypothetical protein
LSATTVWGVDHSFAPRIENRNAIPSFTRSSQLRRTLQSGVTVSFGVMLPDGAGFGSNWTDSSLFLLHEMAQMSISKIPTALATEFLAAGFTMFLSLQAWFRGFTQTAVRS